MNTRFLKELKKQLPILKRNDVIDEKTAEKISSYYKIRQNESSGTTILTIVGSLAAILIGSGIILLFAYNWNEIPKWLRTCLSFLPLIGGQPGLWILIYSLLCNSRYL